jgi:hypothetical protein
MAEFARELAEWTLAIAKEYGVKLDLSCCGVGFHVLTHRPPVE